MERRKNEKLRSAGKLRGRKPLKPGTIPSRPFIVAMPKFYVIRIEVGTYDRTFSALSEAGAFLAFLKREAPDALAEFVSITGGPYPGVYSADKLIRDSAGLEPGQKRRFRDGIIPGRI